MRAMTLKAAGPLSALVGMLAAAALAAPASSQPGCDSPREDSALNVYCEELPAASGDRGNANGAGRSLDRQIEQSVASGQGREAADKPAPKAARGSADDPSGAVGGIGSAIESGGGDETGFVLLIAGLTLGTAALIWLLRRRRSADG